MGGIAFWSRPRWHQILRRIHTDYHRAENIVHVRHGLEDAFSHVRNASFNSVMAFSYFPQALSGGPLWRTSLANQIVTINYEERVTRDSKAVNLDLQLQPKKIVVKNLHRLVKSNVGTPYANMVTSAQVRKQTSSFSNRKY